MTDEEKAKLGYQMAIEMITYEGQLIWRSFASMVTANSLIIALAGFGLKVFPGMAGQKLVPCFGIAICVCWFLVISRQYGTYGYWFAWARALESEYLSPVVRTISVGAEFARGSAVTVGTRKLRQNLLGRLFKVQWLTYVVILTFLLLYALLLMA